MNPPFSNLYLTVFFRVIWEGKFDCGGFPGDCRSIYGMRSDFICSEEKEVLFEVIADAIDGTYQVITLFSSW